MNIEYKKTKDNSYTLYLPELNETYHSLNGAYTESMHVFIKNGYHFCRTTPLSVLEIGFGTGLNAILTFIENKKEKREITYHSIEKYPLQTKIIKKLNYNTIFNKETYRQFIRLHQLDWNKEHKLTQKFTLKKIEEDLSCYTPDHLYDLIFFDAFGPDKQPAMWTNNIFSKIYNCMNKNGIIVTYSAKGSVRRMIQEMGFVTERIPGPPGKREMLRGKKK